MARQLTSYDKIIGYHDREQRIHQLTETIKMLRAKTTDISAKPLTGMPGGGGGYQQGAKFEALIEQIQELEERLKRLLEIQVEAEIDLLTAGLDETEYQILNTYYITDEITLSDLADKMHISERQLYRIKANATAKIRG